MEYCQVIKREGNGEENTFSGMVLLFIVGRETHHIITSKVATENTTSAEFVKFLNFAIISSSRVAQRAMCRPGRYFNEKCSAFWTVARA